MTIPQETQAEVKVDTTEINLAKQRKHYEKQLEQERSARQQAEERAAMAEKANSERGRLSPLNEDDDDEPYVDKKKLNKAFSSFEEKMERKIDQKAEEKASTMIENERRNSYLKENADFNQVMNEDTLQKFSMKHPKLAESLLRMPEGFERQKLVYENIKALGVDRPDQRGPSVQEKIDANRKSPYYQPSGVGAAPYASAGDFSASGQKNAYDKMQELKARLRI